MAARFNKSCSLSSKHEEDGGGKGGGGGTIKRRRRDTPFFRGEKSFIASVFVSSIGMFARMKRSISSVRKSCLITKSEYRKNLEFHEEAKIGPPFRNWTKILRWRSEEALNLIAATKSAVKVSSKSLTLQTLPDCNSQRTCRLFGTTMAQLAMAKNCFVSQDTTSLNQYPPSKPQPCF